MAGHIDYSQPTGPVGPPPQAHGVVYTTLHYDTPWSYDNYLKTGGYSAWRKILSEKIAPADRAVALGIVVVRVVRHYFSPSSSSSTFAASSFSW